jgi:hypothetical protein
LRFITLNFHPAFNGDNHNCFRKLDKSIKRLTVNSLINDGYLSKSQARYFYGSKDNWDKQFKFDYLKVTTTESNGCVFHILYFGEYIPQLWLYNKWCEYQGIYSITLNSVDIRQCENKIYDQKRLARYCVSQYVSGQDEFLTFSWSWSWVYNGFVKDWNSIKLSTRPYLSSDKNVFKGGYDNNYGSVDIKLAIDIWENWLTSYSDFEESFLQTNLEVWVT